MENLPHISTAWRSSSATDQLDPDYDVRHQQRFTVPVADSEILKKAETEDKLSALVVIYRKCTQQTRCLLYGKDGLLKKILSQ